MKTLLASLRLVLVTLAVCCIAYPLLMLGIARVVARDTAEGSLIAGPGGTIIGSRQIAQSFTEPRYLWPRPSAVDYNGASAAGSNLSPTNPALTARAHDLIATYGASPARPIPADLVTASGSGLDPHITIEAAEYQVSRVAAARQLSADRVRQEIDKLAAPAGGLFAPARIVNVLELNLSLDSIDSQR